MSKKLYSATLIALTMALAAACGSKEPAATPQPVAIAPTPPPAPTVMAMLGRNGVVWRYTDNDWVVRATITMTNGTPAAQAVARASFQLPGYTAWGSDSDFPESVTLAPGQTVTGDIAWYINASQPQPTSLSIGYAGLTSAIVPLVRAPAPVQHGQGLTAPSENIPITVTGDAITWIHTDGDRSVRANVKVQNTSSGTLAIPRSFIRAVVGTDSWTGWSGGATLADPLVLAPGQTVEGWASWYTHADPGAPAEIAILIGPLEGTQRVTARVVAGPAPQ